MTTENDRKGRVLAAVDREFENAVERLLTLVKIPSISTDPAHARNCRQAADWLTDLLTDLGFVAKTHETDGHPVVVGHSGGAHQRMLFYGHYDVQPADPLDLWVRPPFEADIIDAPYGKAIHGRGASDDKGQFMTFLEACRAWKQATGTLPEGLVVMLEGEEECGSISLAPFLEEHQDMLRADLALVCDTGLHASRQPAIMTSLRGLLSEEITITGPAIDLHSGLYGGLAVNPLRVLSSVLASLHDKANRVMIPGFYRDVRPTDHTRVETWEMLNFDTGRFLGKVGLAAPVNEEGFSALEALWSRPTCEINGMTGGYTGDGFKTVLPSQASAKISFRLVADQDPDHLRERFRAFVMTQIPSDCTVNFTAYAGEKACTMDTTSPLFEASLEELNEEWQALPVMTGSGGSIPVTTMFREILGMNSLLTGFSRGDDAIHSPNEKYSLDNFRKGIRSWARILSRAEELETL